jgi:hypothetical protein
MAKEKEKAMTRKMKRGTKKNSKKLQRKMKETATKRKKGRMCDEDKKK